MPVRQKIQPRTKPAAVSRALRHLLTWGDVFGASRLAARDGSDPWELFATVAHEDRAAWAAIEAEALREWARVYPGLRPTSWWYWSAPDLRQLAGGKYQPLSGRGRCHATGIPYIGQHHHDPPTVESTPAYLDRLGLWLRGERARVSPAAFAAEPFSYDLCASPGAPVATGGVNHVEP